MRTNAAKAVIYTVFTFAGLVGLWAAGALVAGLHQANWQVTELLRQYMIATGMIRHFNTLVDYYTHIKGAEYLICLAFFVVFPVFYRYVTKDKSTTDRARITTRG